LSGREKGGVVRVVGAISSGFQPLEAEVIVGVLGNAAAVLPAERRVVRFGRRGPLDVLAAARLATFVRKERIAVVHTHNVTANLYGLLLKLLMPSLIHIIHVHGNFTQILVDSGTPRLKRFLLLRGNARALRTCDRIIAVSSGVREFLAVRFADVGKIHVINNAVDVPHLEQEARLPCKVAEVVAGRRNDRNDLRPGGTPSRTVRLVGVFGRLAPVKNYPMFLQAARLVLREEPAKFVIVGDGPERARLERVAADLGITADVHFTGWLLNPYPLLAATDVVVSTSSTEGFPVGLLEAMALGRPVVATDVGAVREIVREGVTGLLVPSGDAPALAGAIVRLLQDSSLCHSLGARGREVARAEFSPAAMRAGVEEVYLSALQRRHFGGAPVAQA
jgi:glycosyltransferase involved in cell wall biosynthesis